MTSNLFDYFEETPAGGTPARWAARAPRRPHANFDIKLTPRLPDWREDRESLAVLERIEREPWVKQVRCEGDCVQLRLDDGWIETIGASLEAGASTGAALADLAHGERFSVQFWDANATKALHIGHLRNLAIGNALAATLTQAGAQVERRSLISDAGRSMGEAMAGVMNSGRHAHSWPDGDEKSDHFVGVCYADYVAANGSFSGAEIEYPEDSLTRELALRDDAADELLRRVMSGELEALQLWYKTRAWVIAGQRKTLARLGVAFDRVFFESDFLGDAAQLTAAGLRDGRLRRREDGVVIYATGLKDFEEFPLVRADGVPTQHMRSLAYWMAAPELDGMTSMQVCGTEWVSHVTCRRKLMSELLPRHQWSSSGNGTRAAMHPSLDIFNGMVSRQKRALASSEGALLIDDLIEALDKQIDASPAGRAVRQGTPSRNASPRRSRLGTSSPTRLRRRSTSSPCNCSTTARASAGTSCARAPTTAACLPTAEGPSLVTPALDRSLRFGLRTIPTTASRWCRPSSTGATCASRWRATTSARWRSTSSIFRAGTWSARAANTSSGWCRRCWTVARGGWGWRRSGEPPEASRRPWRRPRSLMCAAHFAHCVLARNDDPSAGGAFEHRRALQFATDTLVAGQEARPPGGCSVNHARGRSLMSTLLVDNYDSYTYNVFHLLASVSGEEPIVIHNDVVSWRALSRWDFDAIVLSPGPGHPGRWHDFGVCADILRSSEIPVLGICLGHQGLGRALSGLVGSAPCAMHGRLSQVRHLASGLFEGLPQDFSVVRYHSLAVSGPIGPEGRVTAWTDDGVVMGIEHCSRPLWGVQFHPESVATEYGRAVVENFYSLARAHRPARAFPTIRSPTAPRARTRRARVARADGLGVPRLSVRTLTGAAPTEPLFERLFGACDHAFWLDSADAPSRLAQCSYLGTSAGPERCVLEYDVHEGRVTRHDAAGVSVEEASIFDVLDRELAARALPSPEGAARGLLCGFVGYLGYECKADCGGSNVHRSDVPDAVQMLATRVVAVDHVQGLTHLLALGREGEAEVAVVA